MNESFHNQRKKRLRAHLTTKALQTGTILETNNQKQHKVRSSTDCKNQQYLNLQ
jgi:hypothetical protein